MDDGLRSLPSAAAAIYLLKRTQAALARSSSSQVTFIYIALLTIQIVSKQPHNIKIGKLCITNVK